MAPAHAQRTGAATLDGHGRAGPEQDEDGKTGDREPGRGRQQRERDRGAQEVPGSAGRKRRAAAHGSSGVAAGDDDDGRTVRRGPRDSRPAHDAAAAPSTVMPSASVSTAWAAWSSSSLTVTMSSTRPVISSTARGMATREAMPSA